MAKVGLDSKSEFPLVVDGMHSAQVFKEDRPIRARLGTEQFLKKGKIEAEKGSKKGKIGGTRITWTARSVAKMREATR